MMVIIMELFDSWEAKLYHDGIKGMRWGVRRYQNYDGTLTAAGKLRYGENSEKHVSARKLSKDFNNLDKGYANAAARLKRANYVGERLSGKAIKKGKSPEEAAVGTDRLSRKLQKAAAKRSKAENNMKSIESMQYRILAKAAKQGYTVTSKAVKRYGSTGANEMAQFLGGPLANIAVSIITRGSTTGAFDGQKIKVHKNK